MDPWMSALAFLAVLAMAFAGGFDQILWRLEWGGKHGETYRQSDLNTMVKFVMPKTQCIHVVTDGTPFTFNVLENLHLIDDGPLLTLEGPWSEAVGCKSFVVIAANKNASQVLQRLPRWSDHRILVIAKTISTELRRNISLFRDAEAALVSAFNLEFGHMLKQDERKFVFFHPNVSEPWEILEDGPGNFFGRNISALTSNCTMFSQIGPMNSHGEPGWTGGAEMIMFQEIAERLNLKPRFNVTNSIHAGWYKEPVTRDDPSDVAFCGVLVTSKTLNDKKMTISQPLALLCLKLLVPRPKPVHNQWDEIFKTFTLELWLLSAVVSLFITFVLQRFTTETRKLVYTKNIKKYELLGESFIDVLSTLALTNLPSSVKEQGPVRHILTWFSIFTLVLTTSFSCGLISHLTYQEYTKKIDTIEGLVRNNSHWAMKNWPEFGDLLDLNVSDQVRWKYRFIKVTSSEEHIDLITKGNQALWGYEAYGGFSLPDSDLPDQILREFEVSSHCFSKYYIGYALRQGSPYKLPINRYIRWYTEAGLVGAIIKRVHSERYLRHPYVYSVLEQTKPRPSEAEGLVLSQLSGVFIFWCVGTGVSVLVFLLEIAQKYRV